MKRNSVLLRKKYIHNIVLRSEMTDPDSFTGNIKITFGTNIHRLELVYDLGVEMLDAVVLVQV